jgi:hypothetical protein
MREWRTKQPWGFGPLALSRLGRAKVFSAKASVMQRNGELALSRRQRNWCWAFLSVLEKAAWMSASLISQ